MPAPVVLVTDHPAPSIEVERKVLEEIGAEIEIAGGSEDLGEMILAADAILTCFRNVPEDAVRRADRLRVIGRYGVGVDNIPVDAATEKGIVVCNVSGYCSDEVAEHTISLLLALARQVVTYDREVRTGRWDPSCGMPIHRLKGKTLGLVGFGAIGREVCIRARGLGLRVLVVGGRGADEQARAIGAMPAPLEELLRESDFVSLHVPLTEETRHLIGPKEFAAMKRSAYLVNAARGAIVDSNALVDALRSGQIAGAALDVFEAEPPPSGHPLRDHPKVILTPHVAFYSEESMATLCDRAARNVLRLLKGEVIDSVVNPNALAHSNWVTPSKAR